MPVRLRIFRENRANFSAKLMRIYAPKSLNYFKLLYPALGTIYILIEISRLP